MNIDIEKLSAMTVSELNSLSNDLDVERNRIMQLKRAVHKARLEALEAENAAVHGLTVDSYRAAKEIARIEDVPLSKVLAASRKRAVQIARAGAASVGSVAKGPG